MDRTEFQKIRRVFNKSQREMAQLLGVSVKAVNSYEQGWRNIPHHVERQSLFLLSLRPEISKGLKNCWKIKSCGKDMREGCPAWGFRAGKMCWFINGTICEGKPQGSWKKKMEMCRKCKMLRHILSKLEEDSTAPKS